MEPGIIDGGLICANMSDWLALGGHGAGKE
jgi:hypothetical protein